MANRQKAWILDAMCLVECIIEGKKRGGREKGHTQIWPKQVRSHRMWTSLNDKLDIVKRASTPKVILSSPRPSSSMIMSESFEAD